jgi:hypothetical protein
MLQDAGVLSLYAILPADFTGPLPDITQSWSHFRTTPQQRPTLEMWQQFEDLMDWHDRPRQFREFVNSIQPSSWPTLHFLHILLPHAPWVFLPSGQRCMLPASRIRGLRGVNDQGQDANWWTDDAWAAAQSYQRHLLQVEYVDRLVGSLVKHLRNTGLYDSVLLVITADHGASFRPGDSRRAVTETNHADIMSVPLFIKYPHQEQGGIDDRSAENVDILPTVLDVIKMKAGKLDGNSLLGAPAARHTKVVVTGDERALRFPAGLDALFASVKRKVELFGGSTEDDIFRLGDRYGWIGREPGGGAIVATKMSCQLDRDTYYQDVDTKAPMLLTNIAGEILGGPAASSAAPIQLAVGVNGTVRAITQTFPDGDHARFTALVPRASLHPGNNNIEVYFVLGATRLGSILRVAAQEYEWGTDLRFGIKGNVGAYYGIGWSRPEEGVTWTEGHMATLYLPAPQPRGDVAMTATLSAFAPAGKIDHQRVRVLVNHREVARWEVKGDFQAYTAVAPKENFRGGVAEIEFELPDAASPVEMGTGTDPRTLGIAAVRLKLEPMGGK